MLFNFAYNEILTMFLWKWRRRFFFLHILRVVLFRFHREHNFTSYFVRCTEYYFICLNCFVHDGLTGPTWGSGTEFRLRKWCRLILILVNERINQTNKSIGIGHCHSWGVSCANCMLNTECTSDTLTWYEMVCDM